MKKERTRKLSPDQLISLSFQLRSMGFGVLEDIKGDRIVKTGKISLITRNGFDEEYNIGEVALVLTTLNRLHDNWFYKMLLNRLGLKQCGKILCV